MSAAAATAAEKGKEKSTAPHPSESAFANAAKVDLATLTDVRVDESAVEQLDKVAMFFNARQPANKNGECESIYRSVPNVDVLPLVDTKPMATVEGPVDEEILIYKDVASARTVSTYPRIAGTNLREGDPICDRFLLRLYKNRAIIALADGCNWGSRPREAATKATQAFANYLESRHTLLKDLPEVGHCCLRAFSVAHDKIIEGKDDVWEAGTTTMLGGVLVQLKNSSDGRARWSFIVGSVGDCKSYHYSKKHDAVTDITEMNRLVSNSVDAKDPGGRIGPYVGQEGHPDLRNLALFHLIVREGDMIFCLSDGIHDNMDPALLGKLPFEVASVSFKTWQEMKAVEAEKLRTKFRNAFLKNVIHQSNRHLPTIVHTLVAHAYRVTRPSRDFMENNVGKKQPGDLVKFPGKMDHSSCIGFRVGKFGELDVVNGGGGGGGDDDGGGGALSPASAAGRSPSATDSTPAAAAPASPKATTTTAAAAAATPAPVSGSSSGGGGGGGGNRDALDSSSEGSHGSSSRGGGGGGGGGK